ncbi:MAG TPA: alpha/beta fold hydrolase, partial [Chitinolyticbacter sp.]|nr:alpha/beta fold hydrolase [Chitinolyticbacter sp.]
MKYWISLIALWGACTASAQTVTLDAADGLKLYGDWLASAQEGKGAVVLLHMTVPEGRKTWAPLLPKLQAAGWSVLAVDLRGFGQTGGLADWELAPRDVDAWLTWLARQPGVDPKRIALVGASAGANLALQACAGRPACPTVVALSPADNEIFGAAMMKSFLGRSVAIYAGRYDRDANTTARRFLKDD